MNTDALTFQLFGAFATATATIIASIVALISAITAAFFAARAAVNNSERKILIENITQERAKWREKVRARALEVHKAAVKKDTVWLKELKLSFAISLNPLDEQDNLIIELIDKLKDETDQEAKLSDFSARIALLLKHDWERAKNEAQPNAKKYKGQRLILEDLKCRSCGK